MINLKRIYIIIGVIVLAAVVVGLAYWQYQKVSGPAAEEIRAYEFAAQIEKVDGNTIETKGIYLIPGKEDWTGPKYEKNMTITVDSSTKFIKVTKILPTREELKKTDGYFESGNLQSREEAGSLADLQNGVVKGFVAKSDKDIYKTSSFVPAEIKYYVSEMPAE